MDGSNLTHKLQLSVILCGKTIKEEENPKWRAFGQEPRAADPALLVLGSGCLMRFRIIERSLQNLDPGGVGKALLPKDVSHDHELCSPNVCEWREKARDFWLSFLEGQRETHLEMSLCEHLFRGTSFLLTPPSLCLPLALWDSVHVPLWLPESLAISTVGSHLRSCGS